MDGGRQKGEGAKTLSAPWVLARRIQRDGYTREVSVGVEGWQFWVGFLEEVTLQRCKGLTGGGIGSHLGPGLAGTNGQIGFGWNKWPGGRGEGSWPGAGDWLASLGFSCPGALGEAWPDPQGDG